MCASSATRGCRSRNARGTMRSSRTLIVPTSDTSPASPELFSRSHPPVSCVGVQPSCKGERFRSPEGGLGMAELETPDALRDDLRTAWHRYIDMLVPLRPALYGYCRRLAGNVWDTEDLVQDTLLRAFGHWGVTYPAIRDPRAYLLRTATNVWIDTLRRRDTEARALMGSPDDAPASGANPETSSHVRDAGARL